MFDIQLRMRRLSLSRLIELSRESAAPTMPETNVHRDFSSVQASMKKQERLAPPVRPHVKIDTNETRGGADPNVRLLMTHSHSLEACLRLFFVYISSQMYVGQVKHAERVEDEVP